MSAQRVVITDQLDADLDWSTFQFGTIQFGERTLLVPDPVGRLHFETDTTVSYDAYPVHVTADLDPQTGIVTWELQSVDPQTGRLPHDLLAGFLPPNDDQNRGAGSVSYRVRPKTDLSHGTQLCNQASIVFDFNEPIITNEVVYAIDAIPPSSAVASLAATMDRPHVSGVVVRHRCRCRYRDLRRVCLGQWRSLPALADGNGTNLRLVHRRVGPLLRVLQRGDGPRRPPRTAPVGRRHHDIDRRHGLAQCRHAAGRERRRLHFTVRRAADHQSAQLRRFRDASQTIVRFPATTLLRCFRGRRHQPARRTARDQLLEYRSCGATGRRGGGGGEQHAVAGRTGTAAACSVVGGNSAGCAARCDGGSTTVRTFGHRARLDSSRGSHERHEPGYGRESRCGGGPATGRMGIERRTAARATRRRSGTSWTIRFSRSRPISTTQDAPSSASAPRPAGRPWRHGR